MRRAQVAVNRLIIGTRGSKLALWQTNHIKEKLESRHRRLSVEIKIIKTKGDRIQDVALAKIGGKGLFIKEIEEAMLAGVIHLAVHSLKDLPTDLPAGLVADIIPKRTHGADVLVSRQGSKFTDLPPGARVGTGSLRRKVQLRALRPELEYLDLRGNVDTRLAKLDRGDYEAIILSEAGLIRLGLSQHITEVFSPDVLTPAAGQGALAIEYRQDDSTARESLIFLADRKTTAEVEAERDFLHTLGGGCQVPVGAQAEFQDNGKLSLTGMISDLSGRRLLRDQIEDYPEKRPGRELAEKMLAAGGKRILEEIYGIGS